mmetsp:Transcript_14175/g.16436  ORF Transcript_14175/g.16436 Transcript_14175/m.16436 type:complete len:324 (+) Transcript_14175:291-1262(+)
MPQKLTNLSRLQIQLQRQKQNRIHLFQSLRTSRVHLKKSDLFQKSLSPVKSNPFQKPMLPGQSHSDPFQIRKPLSPGQSNPFQKPVLPGLSHRDPFAKPSFPGQAQANSYQKPSNFGGLGSVVDPFQSKLETSSVIHQQQPQLQPTPLEFGISTSSVEDSNPMTAVAESTPAVPAVANPKPQDATAAKKTSKKTAAPPRESMLSRWKTKIIQSVLPIDPDATKVKAGSLKELDAYYDENLKRWIFPGEQEEANAGPQTDQGPPKATPPMQSMSLSGNNPRDGPQGPGPGALMRPVTAPPGAGVNQFRNLKKKRYVDPFATMKK